MDQDHLSFTMGNVSIDVIEVYGDWHVLVVEDGKPTTACFENKIDAESFAASIRARPDLKED